MTRTFIARRIVLRLDPATPGNAAVAAAVRLARSLDAELAARMILDTRLASAVAVHALAESAIESSLRRAEAGLRRFVSRSAEQEHAQWSFEVVHCAGVLAEEVELTSGDVVAIDVPAAGFAASGLRPEIASALARARGVILFPQNTRVSKGPVVVAASKPSASLLDAAAQIAASLRTGVSRIAGWDPELVAAHARKTSPALVMTAHDDPLTAALLSRSRYLRELAAPLLLLNTD